MVPNIRRNLIFIFLTWQKIVPLFLLLNCRSKFLLKSAVLCNVVAARLSRMGRKSLNILMFFSRLLQTGFVLSAPKLTATKFFLLYAIILAPIFYGNGRDLPLLLLNLAGIPPFTGFFMKLMVLQKVTLQLSFILLISSMLVLYAYMYIYQFGKLKSGRLLISTLLVSMLGLIF